MARRPSVRIVLYRQSKIPPYRFPVWLYIRAMIVSVCGGEVRGGGREEFMVKGT